MRSHLTTAVAVCAVVLLGGACAPATGAGSDSYLPDELAPARAAAPTVRVTNNNWSNMTVYAVRGSTRFRLGMVASMSTVVFRVPPSVLSGGDGLRLLADPIGGSESYQTPAIYVNPGEVVRLDLQNQLSISSYSVFGQR